VAPFAQAQVGTIVGGVILQISVGVGDVVREQQEVARIRGVDSSSVELVLSPIQGTVADVLVHAGDTVAPGAIVAVVADLHRLQVETTDVDEYIVGQIHQGQMVALTVDALNRERLTGVVRVLALVPRMTSAGDQHYPVTIDLDSRPPGLRPGMTVKITFAR
jgi:multidrug resistance efflux pump